MTTVSPLMSTMMYRSFVSLSVVKEVLRPPTLVGKGGEQGKEVSQLVPRGHGTQVTSIRIPDAPPTLSGTGFEVFSFGWLWNHDTHSWTVSGAGTSLLSLRLFGSKTWRRLAMTIFPQYSGTYRIRTSSAVCLETFHAQPSSPNSMRNAGSNSSVT